MQPCFLTTVAAGSSASPFSQKTGRRRDASNKSHETPLTHRSPTEAAAVVSFSRAAHSLPDRPSPTHAARGRQNWVIDLASRLTIRRSSRVAPVLFWKFGMHPRRKTHRPASSTGLKTARAGQGNPTSKPPPSQDAIFPAAPADTGSIQKGNPPRDAAADGPSAPAPATYVVAPALGALPLALAKRKLKVTR